MVHACEVEPSGSRIHLTGRASPVSLEGRRSSAGLLLFHRAIERYRSEGQPVAFDSVMPDSHIAMCES